MKKVKYAKFHADLFIPGPGVIGQTLPSTSKSFDLTMWHDDDGLLIKINYSGRRAMALVPWSNVVLVQYDESPVPDGNGGGLKVAA